MGMVGWGGLGWGGLVWLVLFVRLCKPVDNLWITLGLVF